MRILSLALVFVVGSAVLPAQDKKQGDPAAAVKNLQASLREVIALGKLAERPLIKERRVQKVKAAVPAMRFLSKKLKKITPPSEKPAADVVTGKVKKFSKALGDCVLLAGGALEAAKGAVGSAEGLEKNFFSKVHELLYVQIAMTEIKGFLVNDSYNGTYDGMFPGTSKYGKAGAAAFLNLFTDIDQPIKLRELAGEGVAQIGTKDDVESVREVYDDDLEDQSVRDKAKQVLARLGDFSLLQKDLDKVDAQIKNIAPKVEPATKRFRELLGKAQKMGEPKTDEEKAEAKKLREQLQKANGELTNYVFNLGNLYNAKAFVYQGVRVNDKTEHWYKEALAQWTKIGQQLFRDPRARGRVNIAWYNLACVQSLQKKTADAMKSFEQCFKWGYTNYAWARKDGDLTNIRELPAFEKLIDEVKSGKAKERWKKEAEEQMKKAKAASDAAKPKG